MSSRSGSDEEYEEDEVPWGFYGSDDDHAEALSDDGWDMEGAKNLYDLMTANSSDLSDSDEDFSSGSDSSLSSDMCPENASYSLIHVSDSLTLISNPENVVKIGKKTGDIVIKPRNKQHKIDVLVSKCLDNGTVSIDKKIKIVKSDIVSTATAINSLFTSIFQNVVPPFYECFALSQSTVNSTKVDDFRVKLPHCFTFHKTIQELLLKIEENNIPLGLVEAMWRSEVSSFARSWNPRDGTMATLLGNHGNRMRNIWLNEFHEVRETWEVDGTKVQHSFSDAPAEKILWEKPCFEGQFVWAFADNLTTEGRNLMARRTKAFIRRQILLKIKENKGRYISKDTFYITKF